MDEFLEEYANAQRLIAEYNKHNSLVVAFDFDGTVHDYHKTGASHEMVIQLLRDLKSISCTLVCWTAYPDLEYVKQFCIDKQIPVDHINEGGIPLGWESKKPFFSALLDDRAGLLSAYKDLRILYNAVKMKS